MLRSHFSYQAGNMVPNIPLLILKEEDDRTFMSAMTKAMSTNYLSVLMYEEDIDDVLVEQRSNLFISSLDAQNYSVSLKAVE